MLKDRLDEDYTQERLVSKKLKEELIIVESKITEKDLLINKLNQQVN